MLEFYDKNFKIKSRKAAHATFLLFFLAIYDAYMLPRSLS